MDQGVRHVLQKCTVGTIAKVNEVMEHRLDNEITIWGASTARVHLDAERVTQELGIECFNMGMDGTPLDQYSGLLREYISYSRKSKVVVLVIDVNGLGARNSLYQGYAWLHYIGNPNVYESLVRIDKELAVRSRYIPLYYLTQYDRRFLPRSLKSIYGNSPKGGELSNRGFHANQVPWQEKQHPRYSGKFDVAIDERVVEEIDSILDLTKAANMELVIVIPPCYIEGLRLITNLRNFETVISSFGDRGVLILNYLRDPIGGKKNLFSNNTHLNAQGAELLTSQFINDLGRYFDSAKSSLGR